MKIINSKKSLKKSDSRNIQNLKVEPSEEEVQKQIRETLEKLQSKSSKSKGAKHREKREFNINKKAKKNKPYRKLKVKH